MNVKIIDFVIKKNVLFYGALTVAIWNLFWLNYGLNFLDLNKYFGGFSIDDRIVQQFQYVRVNFTWILSVFYG